MTLTAKDVAEITRLVEESGFDELTLELEGLKLTLRRTGAAAPVSSGQAAQPATATPSEAGPGAEAVAAPAAPVPGGEADAATQAVTAPLLGTFYRAPKPGAPPFVEVGSVVQEETIVGIIEVMKLMNTVRAGTRGTVVDILAQDGALVEYGQILLRVDKAVSA